MEAKSGSYHRSIYRLKRLSNFRQQEKHSLLKARKQKLYRMRSSGVLSYRKTVAHVLQEAWYQAISKRLTILLVRLYQVCPLPHGCRRLLFLLLLLLLLLVRLPLLLVMLVVKWTIVARIVKSLLNCIIYSATTDFSHALLTVLSILCKAVPLGE